MERKHPAVLSRHPGLGRLTGRSGGADGAADARARRAGEVRERVRLMIEITARAGAYRKGLLGAVARLSPEEAGILSDLEQHGLQVPQLHDVLCGGHVLVDAPELYERWRGGKGSHPRISSHHRDIDKRRYPDIGMHGHVVREKLHGRTTTGTWVQLEKTPAAFGGRRMPSLGDLRHLADYVVYRFTGSNVGPWGLSRMTERRPMYLSPRVAVPTALTGPVADALTATLRRIERSDDTTAVSRELAAAFPPPDRPDLAGELGQALPGRAGRGLFGNSEVWITQTPSRIAARVLRERCDRARDALAARAAGGPR